MTIATSVMIEKKLYGMERTSSPVAFSPAVAAIVPVTNIPHNDMGKNELITVGSML